MCFLPSIYFCTSLNSKNFLACIIKIPFCILLVFYYLSPTHENPIWVSSSCSYFFLTFLCLLLQFVLDHHLYRFCHSSYSSICLFFSTSLLSLILLSSTMSFAYFTHRIYFSQCEIIVPTNIFSFRLTSVSSS